MRGEGEAWISYPRIVSISLLHSALNIACLLLHDCAHLMAPTSLTPQTVTMDSCFSRADWQSRC